MAKIYAIECTKNGKVYVGCTGGKIAKRMREHLCLLRRGKHAEPLFQADFCIYSEKNFRTLCLATMPEGSIVSRRREAELRWMDHFQSLGLLYNQNRTSFQPTPEAIAKGQFKATNTEGKKRSPEANLKRRLAQLGIPKGHGAKISATKRAKQAMR